MAVFHVNFFSEALLRNVNFTAVLPVDLRSVDKRNRYPANKKLRSLYLLHGLYCNEEDWLYNTRIRRLAMEKDIAVIMPSGENKLYLDYKERGDCFKKYISEDLVDFTRNIFKLSARREDTYIAGLSMGGLGAILSGVNTPDVFGKVGAFSSWLVFEDYPADDTMAVGLRENRTFLISMLGEPGSYLNGQADYYRCVSDRADEIIKPDIYMSCGLDDILIESNRKFERHLRNNNYKVDYFEERGGHDWDFWDSQIESFLKWIDQ